MAITYEETIQTVLNLVQEREQLKLIVKEKEAQIVRLTDEIEILKKAKENK